MPQIEYLNRCQVCNGELDDLIALNLNTLSFNHLTCMRGIYEINSYFVRVDKCKNCGKEILVHYTNSTKNKDVYCEQCISSFVSLCDNCHRIIIPQEDNTLHGNSYCEQCYNRLCTDVMDYSFIPKDFNKYGSADLLGTALFFGLELELDCRTSSLKKVFLKDLDRKVWIPKFDSSIPEYGVEIVSYPMTYSYLISKKNDINRLLNIAVEHGMRSGDVNNCGMHIHMSSNAFGVFHLWKYMRFVYHRHNRTFIRDVSHRTDNSLSRWASLNDTNSNIKQRAKRKEQLIDRHHAINISHHNTIETRIFEGTLDTVAFWANVEFCLSLYHYTKKCTAKELGYEPYINYLREHKKNYENLCEILKSYLTSE